MGTPLTRKVDDYRPAARVSHWSGSPHANRGPSVGSTRGLDWFVFFLADVQTGFGPFVAVYLTTQKWTQIEIGLILSVGGLVALLGQIPGGALADWARSERLVAGLAVAMIGVSALAYAAWPIFPIVLSAAVLQAASSCVLGPAIAAISLGLVGRAAISRRLGRNAALCIDRQRRCGGGNGNLRIPVIEPRRISRDRCADNSGNNRNHAHTRR